MSSPVEIASPMVEASASATVEQTDLGMQTKTGVTTGLEDGFKSRFSIWAFGIIHSYRMAGIPNASIGGAFPGKRTG